MNGVPFNVKPGLNIAARGQRNDPPKEHFARLFRWPFGHLFFTRILLVTASQQAGRALLLNMKKLVVDAPLSVSLYKR